MAKELTKEELAEMLYLKKGNATKRATRKAFENRWKKEGWKIGSEKDRFAVAKAPAAKE